VLPGRVQLLPLLAEFLRIYPEVSIDLRLLQPEPNLMKEHLDLAPTIGARPDSTLKGLNLGPVRPVIVASPAYLARHGTPETAEGLEHHEFSTFAGGTGPAAFAFSDGRRLTVRPRSLVSTAEAAVDAAIAGVGLAQLLSHQISPAVRDGRLTPLLREHWGEPMPVQFVRPGDRATPQKVGAFLDFAAPRLSPRLVFEP
jgi:DNA-binding transcriptional LysR family regulator